MIERDRSGRQEEKDVITIPETAAVLSGYASDLQGMSAPDPHYGDPDFLEREELIQRYLRQELSDTELQQIEIAIIANPALIERIEQQRLLNEAFRANAGQLGVRLKPAAPVWRTAIPLAACLLLGVSVLTDRNAAPDNPATFVEVTQAELLLQTLRGGEPLHTVSAAAVLPLRIDVGPPVPGARYRVRLLDEASGAERLRLDGLAADDEGWLLTRIAPGSAQGVHRLEISTLQDGQVRRFLIDFQ